MKFIFLIFLMPLTLLASKILSYNIYDRTDRADVMLTFDTPYHGVIKQGIGNHKIIIKLENATIESPKIKNVNSKFLKTLTITPLKNKIQIVALVPQNIKLVASKTADAYGLRLRFVQKGTQNNKQTTTKQTAQQTLSQLPTKKDEGISTRYYIVIAILFVGVLILFFLKKKITPQNKKKKTQDSWLFQPTNTAQQAPEKQQNQTTQQQSFNPSKINEVSIRFQKAINEHNSVVMIDFGSQSYLVLMGNGNILLDKFIEDQPSTQEEFETMLQSRHQQLEEFLGNHEAEIQKKQETPLNLETKEALNAYTQKASASSIYDNI